jgi:ATP-dependent DNA ligase
MLAKAADQIPTGEAWLYEPKWDGFRALVYFDGGSVYLQSRDLKPLGRYFPELETQLPEALPRPMILDGEIVIARNEALDFEALQMRIHPAESRVLMLSEKTPASFVAFDLLAFGEADLRSMPFGERHQRLAETLAKVEAPVYLTPSTPDPVMAQDWFERFEGAGLDGVVAKRLDELYRPGQRSLVKIKHLRTVDCVVGGFRWNRGEEGRAVGSLLLGLYDDKGVFHHVGHTSSFKAQEKRDLVSFLQPYVSEDDSYGFGQGRTPGAPSRWTGDRDMT